MASRPDGAAPAPSAAAASDPPPMPADEAAKASGHLSATLAGTGQADGAGIADAVRTPLAAATAAATAAAAPTVAPAVAAAETPGAESAHTALAQKRSTTRRNSMEAVAIELQELRRIDSQAPSAIDAHLAASLGISAAGEPQQPTLDSWGWNLWAQTVDQNIVSSVRMFQDYNLLEVLHVDAERLIAFVRDVELCYHPNPYHNFDHAFDVLQTTYSLVHGMRAGEMLTTMDVLVLFIAALGHDVDHPGLTNGYLIATRDPLARLYNDRFVACARVAPRRIIVAPC